MDKTGKYLLIYVNFQSGSLRSFKDVEQLFMSSIKNLFMFLRAGNLMLMT